MIASYTWVLPLFYYPIGLRLENLFASGEPLCVGYLLSPWLRLVRPGGMDPCPPAPNKIPHTQNASLRSMRLDRRTHREHGVRPGVTFFFCWWKLHPSLSGGPRDPSPRKCRSPARLTDLPSSLPPLRFAPSLQSPSRSDDLIRWWLRPHCRLTFIQGQHPPPPETVREARS